jgi:hypothetical protein
VIERPKPQVAAVTPTPEAGAADAGNATPRPPREREGPEDVAVLGGPYTAQWRPSAWLVVGMVGTGIAVVFLAASAVGQRKRGRPGIVASVRSWLSAYLAKRRARLASANEAGPADQPEAPDMPAGNLSERLRLWTGLAGLVEVALALGLLAIWILGRLGLRGLNPAFQTLSAWLGIGGVIQVLILIVMKRFLQGFMTMFPMVGVVASYESRTSLGLVCRAMPDFMLAMIPMMAVVRLVQPHMGLGPALGVGWLVFIPMLALLIRDFGTAKRPGPKSS